MHILRSNIDGVVPKLLGSKFFDLGHLCPSFSQVLLVVYVGIKVANLQHFIFVFVIKAHCLMLDGVDDWTVWLEALCDWGAAEYVQGFLDLDVREVVRCRGAAETKRLGLGVSVSLISADVWVGWGFLGALDWEVLSLVVSIHLILLLLEVRHTELAGRAQYLLEFLSDAILRIGRIAIQVQPLLSICGRLAFWYISLHICSKSCSCSSAPDKVFRQCSWPILVDDYIVVFIEPMHGVVGFDDHILKSRRLSGWGHLHRKKEVHVVDWLARRICMTLLRLPLHLRSAISSSGLHTFLQVVIMPRINLSPSFAVVRPRMLLLRCFGIQYWWCYFGFHHTFWLNFLVIIKVNL